MKVSILIFVLIAGLQGAVMNAAAQGRSGNLSLSANKPRLVVQTGHSAEIRAIAFSSDSQYVATSGSGGDVVIWSIAGKQLQSFRNHGEITDVAISLDNRFVAFIVTGDDASSTVSVRSLENGDEVSRFTLKGESFESLAISPRGDLLLINATSNELHRTLLWNIAQRKIVHRFDASESSAFSPDGRTILVLVRKSEKPSERALQLWNAATRAIIWENNAATDRLFQRNRLAFSPDGTRVMASSTRAKCRYALFDSADGKPISENTCPREEYGDYTDIWISPDQKYFIAFDGNATGSGGNFDNTIRVLDFATGKAVSRLGRVSRVVKIVKATSAERNGLLIGDMLGNAYLWNLAEGKEVRRFIDPAPERFDPENAEEEEETGQGSLPVATISANGRFVLTEPRGRFGEYVYVWDVETGNLIKEIEGSSLSVSVSASGERAVLGRCGRLRFINPQNATEIWRIPLRGDLFCGGMAGDRTFRNVFQLSLDGKYIFVGENDRGAAALLDATSGRVIRRYPKIFGWPVFLSPNGRYVVVGSVLMETFSGKVIERITGDSRAMSFSPDSRTLIVSTTADSVSLFNATTGRLSKHIKAADLNVGDVGFSPDGRFVIVGDQDGSTRFYNPRTGQEICRIFSFKDGSWVVVAPDGRFDTNNLEEIGGLLWIMPDEPLKPLPLEIFMRQYYEPRLLPRLLAEETFNEVPPLAKLNRVQPKVEIKEISKPDELGTLSVTVEVARAKSEAQRDEKGQLLETGVYDLRLFRDGQLVGYAPNEGREVRLDPDGKRTIKFEKIRLPRKAGVKSVEFSAYAFNVSQVKSATARMSIEISNGLQPVKGRVYIVTVGVNAYENTAFDLSFAANDARRLQDVMYRSLLSSGEYEEKDIVQIPLISDYKMDGGKRVVSPNNATKRVFKAVLDLLSGKRVDDPELLKQIPNIDRIQTARPEDVMLISFSSHGYAAPNGDFYFIASDTGPGTDKEPTPELLRRAVSSEELSLWLRDLDAGEMVMIVDACQSTAAVAAAGFKPGPMDSRGFGQLSYDKGMKILTATQSDSVALESKLIEQGLLTYALVHDGIEAGQADFRPPNKVITLSEWLAYGVSRVPGLYAEVKQGKVQTFGRAVAEGEAKTVIVRQPGIRTTGSKALELVDVQEMKIQQPSLFDFTKKQREVVLVRVRN